MATLPKEQVIQRNKIGIVSITSGMQIDAPGETLWQSTTTDPYTVVDTKSVVGNQADATVTKDRVDAAGLAQYGVNGTNIYNTGTGVQYQTLTKLGDTTLAAANNVTVSKDIEPFVASGSGALRYTIGAGTFDNGTPSMVGSVLVYASNAVDGTDTVPVLVSDGTTTVTVNCVVTVA